MNTTRTKRPFSRATRFALVLAPVALAAVALAAWPVLSGTSIGVTLATNPDLERGLILHWTLDGKDVDTASSTAEVRDRSGQGNHGDAVSTAAATITYNTRTLFSDDAQTSFSFNHDNADGGVLVVVVSWNTNANASNAVNSITYNGVNLVDASSVANTNTASSIWYLLNPASGINSLAVTLNGESEGVGAWAFQVTGADETSFVGATTTETGAGTEGTVTINMTTDDGDALVIGTRRRDDGDAVTYEANTTELETGRWQGGPGADDATGCLGKASPGATGNVTVGCTFGNNNNNARAGMEILAGSASSFTFPAGRIGGGMELNGADEYIDGGNIGGGVQTIAFWAKIATSSANQVFLDIDGTDKIETNGSSVVTATSFPAATVYVDGQTSSLDVDTQWHHIVVTDTTGVTASAFNTGTSTTFYGGTIDDVRIYNRALSADEISRLYDLGATTRVNTTVTSNPDLENGLVGHWSFDGKHMTPNVRDRSGQGNHGDLTNFTSTTTTPGRVGQGLQFDGVDDYVDADTLNDEFNSSSGTVILWQRIDQSANIDEQSTYNTRVDGNNEVEIRWNDVGNRTEVFYIAGGTISQVNISGATDNGQWHHVGITWDTAADEVKGYLDGGQASSTVTGLGTWSGSPTLTQMGDNVFSEVFGGALDDVRVYNRALSADEISRLYDLGATTRVNTTITSNPDLESGLVGHWTFDGKDMTPNVRDRSGQGNNGDLNGQTSTTTAIGRIGQALELDGVDDYVDFGNLGSGIQTIAFWMRVATTTSSHKLINIDNTDMIETNASSNVVATSFPAATVYVDSSSASAAISDTRWHHVVVTDTTGVIASTFEVGAATTTGFFGGTIDDVRIYDRELSADEISRLYDLGR